MNILLGFSLLIFLVSCKGSGNAADIANGIGLDEDFVYCVSRERNIPFAGGSGTEEDPYTLCSVEQFNNIGSDTSLYDKYFELRSDLDFAGKTLTMIADETTGYDSVFNGKNHTIGNVALNDSASDYIGIFRRTGANAVLKNIKIYNATITGKSYTGALLGHGAGTIENCHSSGSVTGATRVGGLVGRLWGTVEGHGVYNSSSTATVSGSEFVGGLVGWTRASKFENDFATGNVTSGPRAGGLIGIGDQIYYIHDSYATGNVTGGVMTGGLIGGVVGDIERSYATGTVTSNGGYAGGITGSLQGNLIQSYSTSTIIGTASYVYGGLVGYMYGSKTLLNSFYIGSLSGTTYVGGLIGYNVGSSVEYSFAVATSFSASSPLGGIQGGSAVAVSSTSFWDVETSGVTYDQIDDSENTSTLQGRLTSELKSANTFINAGYDSNIWNISDGSYPTLK